MAKERYLYRKTEKPVDKDLFAELLIAAKGNRTMKAFAETCGVQPSTFTRIVKKQNKGASSMLILQAIAENASEDSDVTLAKLAEANGFEFKIDPTFGSRFNLSYEDKTTSVLTRCLFRKGLNIKMRDRQIDGSLIHDLFDVLVEMYENPFERVLLAVDCAIQRNTQVDSEIFVLERLGICALTAANSREREPIQFVLAFSKPSVFSMIKSKFYNTIVPANVTALLLDSRYEEIIDEFAFLNERRIRPYLLFDGGSQHRCNIRVGTGNVKDERGYNTNEE